MREQISTTNGGSALRAAQRPVASWMRRRMFRTAHIGLFLSGLTAAAVLHSHYAVAQQQQSPLPVQARTQTSRPATFPTQQPDTQAPAQLQLPSMNKVLAATAQAENPAAPATQPAATPVQHALIQSSSSDTVVVEEKRQETIPFRKVIHLSRGEQAGHTRLNHSGQDGVLEKVYRVTYKHSQPVKYELVGKRIAKAPVDMEVLAGYTDRSARALPSRAGLYTRTREIDMVATGYSPYEGSGSGRCATGIRAGYGVVAVDPRVIPLGSKLYVEGYGYALAGDTGGAIKGRRIDLGQNTHHAATMIGRRHVHVYVLSDRG